MAGRTGGAVVAGTAALAVVAGASYAHPIGHTTENHQVVEGPVVKQPNPARPGYVSLVEGPGSARVERAVPGAGPLAGRGDRRASLAYTAQLTDFQLADEESPARVEFADPGASSAWRPQEAFHPWVIDWSFRQLNAFTGASPHTQAGGARAPMDFGLLTGDQSDNQQYNETVWVRQLIEGGAPVDPNSGKSGPGNEGSCDPIEQAAIPDDEGPKYTGVQDYSDYPPGDNRYYDPANPTGQWENWPQYTGLMDRAQLSFTPVGLRRGTTAVPTYIANGNHDGLVQGNEDAIQAFEQIAIGCRKVFTHTPPSGSAPDPSPSQLLGLLGTPVPPDEDRRFVDRLQLKQIYGDGIQGDDHGFAFVDPAENQASNFAASYYAWDPKPGLRFISIDTTSDGGTVQDSSEGNIDDPQWKWLERELSAATQANKLIVVFGHHPVRSLISHSPDEAASPCTTDDSHGHDVNPGCDIDPRNSQPLHDGDDLVGLLNGKRHVVAYVAGHTHENKVLACGKDAGCPEGGNWWEINTSATADWPQQHRLVELMDNRDGTLSVFGTTLDHGSRLDIPGEGAAGGFDGETLAALGRSFSYNDPHADREAAGKPEDRNVELLVDDPRTARITGTPGNDVIVGTPGDDLIICGDGNDTVRAGAGNDVIRCGRGNDFVDGGPGNDRISGDSGNDLLLGGSGNDRIYGRTGNDRLLGQAGNDRLYGGSGNDRMSGGRGNDRLGGSTGKDVMTGDSGRDRVSGQGGNDRVKGGSGNDRVYGSSGRDRLEGQSGNDRLSGGSGNDRMLGGSGRDRLAGGSGRDRLAGGSGNDRLLGGSGRDRLAGGPGRDRTRQ